MSSWEKEHQSMNESISQSIDQSIHEPEFYLIHRVNGRELPVHGNGKNLCHEMSPEQVRDVLVVMEVSRADPDLRQQPVILTISGQEDGVVFTWSLLELDRE